MILFIMFNVKQCTAFPKFETLEKLHLSNYKKDINFGILFFTITISLICQIFPFGDAIVSERYTYVPYIGIFYLLALLLTDF